MVRPKLPLNCESIENVAVVFPDEIVAVVLPFFSCWRAAVVVPVGLCAVVLRVAVVLRCVAHECAAVGAVAQVRPVAGDASMRRVINLFR